MYQFQHKNEQDLMYQFQHENEQDGLGMSLVKGTSFDLIFTLRSQKH